MIENNNDKEESSDQDDGVGVFVQDFALITQLSQETNSDDKEMGSPDSNLPSHAMYAQTKMKKKKSHLPRKSTIV